MQITLGQLILAVIVVAAIVMARRRRSSRLSLSAGPTGQGIVVPGSTTKGWSPAMKRGLRPWVRVGLIAAFLWVLVGFALAFLYYRTGQPKDPAIGAMWAGPIAFLIVGRLDKLRGWGSWIRAGFLTVAVVVLVGTVAAFFWVMVAYG